MSYRTGSPPQGSDNYQTLKQSSNEDVHYSLQVAEHSSNEQNREQETKTKVGDNDPYADFFKSPIDLAAATVEHMFSFEPYYGKNTKNSLLSTCT